MGVTIRDIAREAGVSTATVSRAIRGLPHVDPTTYARVMSVVERWDYAVSPPASHLASGRTGAVAVLVPRLASWYFATLLFGAEPVLQAAELDLLMLGTCESPQPLGRQTLRELRRKVDGFVVLGPDLAGGRLDQLLDLGLPVVVVGACDDRVSSVFVDDVAGAQAATSHLIALGHSRIGMVAGHSSPRLSPDRDRQVGFARALHLAGLPLHRGFVAFGSFSPAAAEAATAQMLASGSRPTALFVVSDEMAIGTLRAIRAAGLTPGVDVSVVGYDDHALAGTLDLSTMAQPVESMGSEGARLLVRHLQDPDASVRQVRLTPVLIARGSTSPPVVQPAAPGR